MLFTSMNAHGRFKKLACSSSMWLTKKETTEAVSHEILAVIWHGGIL